MLLRIEDTDTERNRPELTDDILEMIEWLGLGWDGEPVHQSDRLRPLPRRGRQAAGRGPRVLLRLHRRAGAGAGARSGAARPGYDGFCRDRGLEPGPAPRCGSARPTRARPRSTTSSAATVTVRATARSRTSCCCGPTACPTFLLANVVDDADMGITHVVRGEEHVNGTPKYLLIAEALGLDHHPVFAHLPVLVNEQRKKLSKRRDAVSVADVPGRRATCPRRWSTTSRCSAGGRPTASRSGRSPRSSSCSASTTSRRRRRSSTSRSCSTSTPSTSGRSTPTSSSQRAAPFFAHDDATEAVLRAARRARPRPGAAAHRGRADDRLPPRRRGRRSTTTSWQKGVAKLGDRAAAMLDAAIARLGSMPSGTAPAIEAALLDAAAATPAFVNAEGNVADGKAQAPVRVATTGRAVGPPLYESLAVLGRGPHPRAARDRGRARGCDRRALDERAVATRRRATRRCPHRRWAFRRRPRWSSRPCSSTSASRSCRSCGASHRDRCASPTPSSCSVRRSTTASRRRCSRPPRPRARALRRRRGPTHRRHRRQAGRRPLHRGRGRLPTTSATTACPTRRSCARSRATTRGSRWPPSARFLRERRPRPRRARDRRLPRVPRAGHRRRARPRRHGVAEPRGRLGPRASRKETAAVAVGPAHRLRPPGRPRRPVENSTAISDGS